jgi:UDP-N-acetylmuramate dehydrogenase
MDSLYTKLKQFGDIKTQVPMYKHTTFKIGGPAAYMLTVTDTGMLVAALQYLDGAGVPWFILGGGSNMLVRDAGYDGVVLQMRSAKFEVQSNLFIADAGVPTVLAAQETMKAGLKGFEWGAGVPGTIGGAVRGNAGAMGKDMHDDVHSVEVYKDGEVLTYTNDECNFGYRESRFKDSREVVLRATLALTPYASSEDALESKKQMLQFLKYRNETQPKGYASTGCIFKNVDVSQTSKVASQKLLADKNLALLLQHVDESDEKVQQFLKVGKISAGWLVEQVGMKGVTMGGAEVSPVHGNFIVNTGSATAADVLTLIEEIKERVYTTYGIELEEEVQII